MSCRAGCRDCRSRGPDGPRPRRLADGVPGANRAMPLPSGPESRRRANPVSSATRPAAPQLSISRMCSRRRLSQSGPEDGACSSSRSTNSSTHREGGPAQFRSHVRHGGGQGHNHPAPVVSGVRSSCEASSTNNKRQPPPNADLDTIEEILYAAILYHLDAHPDTDSAEVIAEHLTVILRQAGYRAQSGYAQNNNAELDAACCGLRSRRPLADYSITYGRAYAHRPAGSSGTDCHRRRRHGGLLHPRSRHDGSDVRRRRHRTCLRQHQDQFASSRSRVTTNLDFAFNVIAQSVAA